MRHISLLSCQKQCTIFAYLGNNNDHKWHYDAKKIFDKTPSVIVCADQLLQKTFFFLPSRAYLIYQGSAVINCKQTCEAIRSPIRVTLIVRPPPPFPRENRMRVLGLGDPCFGSRECFSDCEILFSLSHHPDEPKAPLFRPHVQRMCTCALLFTIVLTN